MNNRLCAVWHPFHGIAHADYTFRGYRKARLTHCNRHRCSCCTIIIVCHRHHHRVLSLQEIDRARIKTAAHGGSALCKSPCNRDPLTESEAEIKVESELLQALRPGLPEMLIMAGSDTLTTAVDCAAAVQPLTASVTIITGV